jgi:hypothetical protein
VVNEAKHTQGPWGVEQEGDKTLVKGPYGEFVCAVAMNQHTIDSETRGNTALIVAAPEMLEALAQAVYLINNCKAGMAGVKQWKDLEAQARAAIAKAKGGQP